MLLDRGVQPHEIARLRTGLQIMALHALGDGEAAEEVVQETLTRALEAMNDGAREASDHLGAFVRGIARGVIAEAWTARRRRTPPDTLPCDEDGATLGTPMGGLVLDEEQRRVQRALAELSPGDRKILRLSFHQGLAPAAIAGRLGESAASVRKRKSRALERLRRTFSRSRLRAPSGPPGRGVQSTSPRPGRG